MTRFARWMGVWLGLLGVGLDAVTPLASLAGPAHAAIRVGICTASGFRYPPDTAQSPVTPPTPAERTQCTLCAHCAPSGGHAAIAMARPMALLPWPDRASPPPQYVTSLCFTPWIPGARPRAPPTLFAVS